jgi:hypothetical protein
MKFHKTTSKYTGISEKGKKAIRSVNYIMENTLASILIGYYKPKKASICG